MIERLQAWLRGHPFEVQRALRHWQNTPDADRAWAWYAEHCGVYEVIETLDPIEMAKAEGRRDAFFALWDLANAEQRGVLEIQRAALREGGDDE